MTFNIICPNCKSTLGYGHNQGDRFTFSIQNVIADPPQGSINKPVQSFDTVNDEWVPKALKAKTKEAED